MSKNILTIDLGSNKTFSIIGTIEEDRLRINGYGSAKTEGIKNGIITNIKSTSRSIKESLDNAQRLAGININLATVSISNIYTKNITSVGVINVPNGTISINEIDRVMQIALYNANIPNDYEIIHVIPFRFKVDEQNYIEDPYGMTGTRLEVDTNIILVLKGNLKNFKKSFEDVGISISRVVVNSYSLGISVMNENEKDQGVMIMNLGSEVSSISIYSGYSIQYDYSIKVGSQNITNDLSLILNTPLNIAEYIKQERGDLTVDYEKESEENNFMEIPIIGEDEDKFSRASLQDVQNIIHSRVEEIINLLIDKVFEDAEGFLSKIKLGLILTGGITYIKGVKTIVQDIIPNIPLRIGFSKRKFNTSNDFNHKEFTSALGLIYYEMGQHTEYELDSNKLLYHSKDKYINDYNLKKHSEINQPKVFISEPNKNSDDSLEDINIDNEDPKGFWKFISKIF